MTYTEYLQTPHWQRWRKATLERDEYTCQRCGATDTELHVHHKLYRGWYNELASDLVTLCADCHEKEHTLPSIQTRLALVISVWLLCMAITWMLFGAGAALAWSIAPIVCIFLVNVILEA